MTYTPQLMSDGMAILPIFEEMQANGMPASRRYFEALADEMTENMARLQSRISHRYYGGQPFNPGSPIHVRNLLSSRGLRARKKTPTGEVSTGKQSIEHLRYTDKAIADVFGWREHQHIRDSFCAPILDRIPETADIYPVRCQIKTTRTATRRLASADPNLLAIPGRNELGRKVRDGYLCPDGEVFGGFDLSQIEARALAHESCDSLLCQLFNEGRDIHMETALRLFGEGATKDQRRAAKTINFGIFYGLQAEGLVTQLWSMGLTDWTLESGESALEDWYTLYSGVKEYQEKVERDVMRTGVVHDYWGMPRPLPGIWSRDRRVKAEASRIAVSHKIQGLAQGMIQKSMIWLKDYIRSMQGSGMNVKWVLQVHDELIFRLDEDLWEVLEPLVMEGLTKHCGIELRVPVLAEGHMAKSWGGLK